MSVPIFFVFVTACLFLQADSHLALQRFAENNSLELDVTNGGAIRVHGKLGLSLPEIVGPWNYCEEENDPPNLCIEWGDFARVRVRPSIPTEGCDRVEWTSTMARRLEDCYDLDPNVHWYGGGEVYNQVWPIEQTSRNEYAYLVEGFSTVMENYWLLSNGASLVVDPDTPLYFSLNSDNRPNRVCFVARDDPPYAKREELTLKYTWCTGDNVKEAHLKAINNIVGKPTDIPDENMLIRPLWSTWAEYKVNVNQSLVLDLARRIFVEGFENSSHIEIDDHWETCYGEEEFDPTKFPDPKAMVDHIHGMNLKVTLWVHPFIDYGCPRFNEAMDKGYFIKNSKDKMGFVDWWNSGNTGVIDVTNPEAREWWSARLRNLQAETGIDSFKFDAGETNFVPAGGVLGGDSKYWPQIFPHEHVEMCATFGKMIELRTVHMNQDLPFFVRMNDRHSKWGYDNGLKSMVTALLTFSIAGYPFVLPDMIGGNAYDGVPDKELFVRWMQVNIFMPSVQFSILPWNYDDETVQICRDVLATRELYREDILQAARQAVQDGSPMTRPIFWVDPTDEETFTIDNAYMLGERILVAPVMDQGAVSRDIYLPMGTWMSGNDFGEVHTGPVWLRDYPAPLDTVPFFVKQD